MKKTKQVCLIANNVELSMHHGNAPYGKQCKNCEKMNHFAKMCRPKKVHAVDDDITDQKASLFMGVVQAKTDR